MYLYHRKCNEILKSLFPIASVISPQIMVAMARSKYPTHRYSKTILSARSNICQKLSKPAFTYNKKHLPTYVLAGLVMPGNWLYPGLKFSILLCFLSNLDSVFEFPIQKNLSQGLGGKSFFRLLGQNDYYLFGLCSYFQLRQYVRLRFFVMGDHEGISSIKKFYETQKPDRVYEPTSYEAWKPSF